MTAFMLFCLVSYAQNDVTQFLGIPVDGSKTAMISKLKEKGFRPSSSKTDDLVGEFNGNEVRLQIATTNNKVSRIAVINVNADDESSIKIRFNKLCQQFDNNTKYVSLSNQQILENEDISYEMIVNNKRYEAAFFQRPIDNDEILMAFVQKNYPSVNIENMDSKTISEITEAYNKYRLSSCTHKIVWFTIYREFGKYFIVMFYDNELNRASGSDL